MTDIHKLTIVSSSLLALFLFQLLYLTINNSMVLGFFHESQSQTMLTYTDNKNNFEISYPNNWERSVKLNNEVIFIAPKDANSVSSPAGFVVKAIPTPGKNISTDSATKELTREIQSVHKDFKLESTTPVTLDGKKATQIVFTATDSKLQNRKAIQIVGSNSESLYVLTYKASTDKFGTYENVANQMIKSFKFSTN
jgi:PsbP-like protein